MGTKFTAAAGATGTDTCWGGHRSMQIPSVCSAGGWDLWSAAASGAEPPSRIVARSQTQDGDHFPMLVWDRFPSPHAHLLRWVFIARPASREPPESDLHQPRRVGASARLLLR